MTIGWLWIAYRMAIGWLMVPMGVAIFVGWEEFWVGVDEALDNPQAGRNLSTTMGHSTGLIREQFPVWRGKWWED